MNHFKPFLTFLFILFSFCLSYSQEIAQSLNGKSLPASGTLRVLMIFAEIDYDKNSSTDPTDPIKGTKGWPKGELPVWKDDMFDPFYSDVPKAKMTKFFHDCSFGQLKILGDYLDEIITIKESDVNRLSQYHLLNQVLVQKANEKQFITNSNLSVEDFDLWTLTKQGYPKITPSTDDPLLFDHVMIIYRNYIKQPNATGRASPGRFGVLFGSNTNTYSIFGAYENLPFNMTRHEFIHLVLGDNNFHSGGGQSLGTNYFLPLQGGWGILGAANSCFMISNAWDRDRLGWKGPGKNFTISALNINGKEVSTDLDANNSNDEGIYILRDFVSTGDALRIKLPGIRNIEYPQWIWLENHQTKKFNNSDFDTFQYSVYECTDEPTPGIYAFLQVEKHVKEGPNLYSGYGDFLRAIPATGFYDFLFEKEKVKNNCVNPNMYKAFIRSEKFKNPLTGSSMLEFPVSDNNGDGIIRAREQNHMAIEKRNGEYIYKLPYLGHAGMAFTPAGNNRIGMDTNPTAANMYTLVSGEPGKRGGHLGKDGFAKPNNRVIYLNGISIKVLEQMSGGRIKLSVKFNQTNVSQYTRWCADSIVLLKIKNAEYDLQINNNAELIIDQGLTATRLINPVEYNQQNIFASPTQLFVTPETKIKLSEKSKLVIRNGSKLVLLENSKLIIDDGSKIDVDKFSDLIVNENSRIEIKNKSQLIIRDKAIYDRIKKQNVVSLKGGKFKYCK